MIKKHFLQYSFVAIILCFPVLCFGSSLDAFVLAIQHFDPDHELGIEYEGEEVELMRQVLSEAQESVPAIAGVHVRVDGSLQSEFGPSMFRSLRVIPQGKLSARSDAEVAGLRKISESIGLGCRYDEQTNNTHRSNKFTSITKQIRWDIGRDCNEEEDGRLCENVEIVDWLCSLGVGSVTLREHEYKTISSAELSLGYNSLVDLEYCAKRLATDQLCALYPLLVWMVIKESGLSSQSVGMIVREAVLIDIFGCLSIELKVTMPAMTGRWLVA